MRKQFIYAVFFVVVGVVIGFGAGVYTLPIIIEYQSERAESASVTPGMETDPMGQFNRESPGSDALHWGEGTVRFSAGKLVFEQDVKLAPGPDYRVYLSRKFAETKSEFSKIKSQAIEVGKVKTFSGPLEFELPQDLNIHEYDNVIVWCETFSMYIASARLE